MIPRRTRFAHVALALLLAVSFALAPGGTARAETGTWFKPGTPHTNLAPDPSVTQSVTIVIPPGPNAGMRSDALSKPIFIAADKWYEMGQRLGVDAVLRVGADNTLSTTAAMNSRLTIEVPDLKVGVSK